MRKLELLSPAGDMERLEMAVAYGADAVYFAGTSFGMRSFAGNFSPEELPKAVRYAHDHGVRCHVTVNTMPRNDEIVRLPEYLELIGDCLKILPPDTVIHRISGDGPKSLLIAPEWSGNKRLVLNSIAKYLKEQKIYQGMGLL